MPGWNYYVVYLFESLRHHNMSFDKKTTTNEGKNQKFNRNVREESFEAI